MTPPAGPGQRSVLQTHYSRVGLGPVAYLDETYQLDKGKPRYYVMAAVVVDHSDRDALRKALDDQVPSGFWHTTDALKEDRREDVRDLLRAFREPDESCIIVDLVSVDDEDKDGYQARERVLSRLLTVLCHPDEDAAHPPVRLVVSEEQRPARRTNFDHKIRRDLIAAGEIVEAMTMVTASPGSEHLLWLPDLVCSAYRQKAIYARPDLFEEITDMTTVIQLTDEKAP